jgi:hypothetical protein
VPGHEGVKGNEEADHLAKRACGKPNTFNVVTKTHTLRVAKEEALRNWKNKWIDTIGRGRFSWANRFPPAWKPRAHFGNTGLSREVYGRLMQARLGHAHVGEYYRDFHIPEETGCECGAQLQSRQHVAEECPNHAMHRPLLRDRDGCIIMTDLLGTDEGIRRFSKFLDKTGAFARRPPQITTPPQTTPQVPVQMPTLHPHSPHHQVT